MWNGTMFVDLDWPLNASSLLSASAELLVFAGARVWNVLPSFITDSATITLFKQHLKTYLFYEVSVLTRHNCCPIILPGLLTEYRWMPLRVQNRIQVQMHPWILVETTPVTEFEYYFACTHKCVHLYSDMSPGKMIFAVLELWMSPLYWVLHR